MLVGGNLINDSPRYPSSCNPPKRYVQTVVNTVFKLRKKFKGSLLLFPESEMCLQLRSFQIVETGKEK